MLTGFSRYSVTADVSGQKSFGASGMPGARSKMTMTSSASRKLSETAATSSAATSSSVGGGVGLSGNAMLRRNNDSILDGLVDFRSPAALRKIYRDIFYNDNIAGPAVDMLSNMPFSDFSLSGVEDEAVLRKYQQCVESLQVKTMLPQVNSTMYALGSFVSFMNYNAPERIFDSFINLNQDDCTFTEIPIYGADPLIDLTVPEVIKKLQEKARNDPRARRYLSYLPAIFQQTKQDVIPLEPDSTVYLSRNSLAEDQMGNSIYRRIVPIYLLEKALIKGTVQQAYRRQRAIMHIILGDQDWEPTEDDLREAQEAFMMADADPTNAIVVTRQGIAINEVKQGDSFWKYDNIYDFATNAKLRALGLSEAFLSGDVTYNNMEQALSVFMEQIRTVRENVTHELFYLKLFPALAITNGFVKRESTTSSYFNTIYESGEGLTALCGTRDGAARARLRQLKRHLLRAHADGVRGFDTTDDITQYQIPRLHWHKPLAPVADQQYLELLQSLGPMGLTIPLRMIAAAAGINPEDILAQRKDDTAMRRKMHQYAEDIKEYLPQDSAAGGTGGQAWASVFDPGGDLKRSLIERSSNDPMNDPERYAPYTTDSVGKRMLTLPRERKRLDEETNRRIAACMSRLSRKENARIMREEEEFSA